MIKNAVVSDCGKYRYCLDRTFEDYSSKSALFVMLNPSTADAKVDDPTIKRCEGFATSWGFTGIQVLNLYALRSTNPKKLWESNDPVGCQNDVWIKALLHCYSNVVCAWGNNAKTDRVKQFVTIAKEQKTNLWCLGTTKSGAPRHPLYINASQPLIKWSYK